jgi:glycosyltransferase involved in cell wall biosynthesis
MTSAGAREEPGVQSPGEQRGGPVVCIPVQSPPDVFALCLTSVVTHTPPEVPIIVAEVASVDPAIADIVRDIAHAREVVLLEPLRPTATACVAAAISQADMADILLVHSGCVVGPGWHGGLHRAAYSESHAATASALSNDGGLLSVPERNIPNALRGDLSINDASIAVAAHALHTYPRIPTAVARTVYLRRDALDLAGGLDASLDSVEAAVIDFSQRCLSLGLIHLTADDVFVFFHSSGKLDADENPRAREELADPVIATRYPWFSAQLGESELAADRPLPTALARARRALNGMSVTIDGRSLVAHQTGTHVIVLETIRALAAQESLALRVVVPHDLADVARERLGELDVTLVDANSHLEALQPSDVVHRPFQVFGSADLGVLRSLGERLVITHLDLIAYDNPSYFPSFAHWQHHRMVTRLALALADRVAFLSQDAAAEATEEELVEPTRATVIYPGVTYSYAAGGERARPAGMERFEAKPFMVSLGTDLHHKNRVFALELLAAMRREHDWRGGLVFAGPRVSNGSSAGEEARFLARNPDLADSVLTLGWVSEPEKAWLMEHAVAVCHPSTREGLGLLPFEAASYGRPCIFASTTALAELQPKGSATIVPWNASLSAARVVKLLGDPKAVSAQVEMIRVRANEFSWQKAAEGLLQAYETAMATPARDARRIAKDLLHSEIDRDEVHRKYDELWEGMSKDGQLLVRPGGLLDAEDQRAVLAVASRPWLRRIVLGQARLVRKFSRNPAPLPPPASTRAVDFDLHFREENLEHMTHRQLPETDLSDLY